MQVSVREFVLRTAETLGITLTFSSEGAAEVGTVASVQGDKAKCRRGDVIVQVDPRYFQPTEVESWIGDATKARERLGWEPRASIDKLINEMTVSDYASARRDHLVQLAGFRPFDFFEQAGSCRDFAAAARAAARLSCIEV